MSSIPTASWNNEVTNYPKDVGSSSGRKGPYVSIDAITFVACLGLAIWAAVVNRKTAILGWRFWTAMGFALFYYAFSFTDGIVLSTISEYRRSFLLVELIFGSTVYLALIFLLVAIWPVLFRLLHHRKDVQAAAYGHFHPRWRDSGRVPLWHHFFCGLLGVLYIVRMGLRIAELTETVFYTLGTGPGLLLSAAYEIDLLFSILYFCATIQILVLASIIVRSHHAGNGSPDRYASILTLVLIAIPLVLAAVFSVVLGSIYVAQQASGRRVTNIANLVVTLFAFKTTESVITAVATILSLAALVAIGGRVKRGALGERLDSQSYIIDAGSGGFNHEMDDI